MLTEPMDVLRLHPVRKSRQRKQAFRDDILSYAGELNYPVVVEKGSFGAQNIVIGDPEHADYLVTAHYDTPASIGLPNFITPCNLVIFLAYQLLLVGFFFLAAFVVAVIIGLLTRNSALIFWSAYFTYFGLLFLMMFGPANKNNANDNTSGVVTVLEIMNTLPDHLRGSVCFVLFDLEEAGLIGSASYRKTHKAATDRQTVLNLDCIGDGDEIVLFPTPRLRKDAEKSDSLKRIESSKESKIIRVHGKGFAYCPSDHKNFPYGAGIMAFRRKKGIGIYCDLIHTRRDTVLEYENVCFLRDSIVTLIDGNHKINNI